MIVVENLSKTFIDGKGKSVAALKGISFTAPPGQVFGLIGDNGAGKTTTLRLLSTVIKPTGGSASVGGASVADNPAEVRRNIGFLSGTTGLYGRLTPVEIIRYFGELNGLEGKQLDDRVQQLIADFHISEFKDRSCDKLSTGQKQRVGLARCIVHNPSVLFLDEPTSGLDVQSSQGIMEFIESVRAQGKTIVFSSHIMSEVERLCDSLVILHKGEITLRGTVEEVKQQTGTNRMEDAFLSAVGYTKGAIV